MKFTLLQRTIFRKHTLNSIKAMIPLDYSTAGRLELANQLYHMKMIKTPDEFIDFLN